MALFLLSFLANKAFPFPIFSLLLFFFRFLLFSSLLLSSSFVLSSVRNSKALSIQQQCTEDHFSALLHLKQGFDFSGEYCMTTLSSWNPDNRDCCSWEGITCDGAPGHVTSLDLSELGIWGRIDSESLFHLQSLQRLNLAYNDFDPSPIPSGFEQLTSLTHLNLSSLQFYGQIPLEVSRLTTLVSLDLSYNGYYNGWDYEYLKLENPTIRELFQNLSRLTELHLDYVNISVQGSEWGLALSSALPHLRKLSLRYCGLSGPIHSSLSKLHYLSQLDLSENNLSSVVPVEVPNFIGNLSSLTSLHISDCGLYGKIPESIFRLPNLQTLDVGFNPLLTGQIPPNNTLRQLYLSDTGFCSTLWDSFGNLKHLTMLALGECNLSGQLPSWLVKLDELIYLDLSWNGFSGPLPSSLANLSNLVHLDLSFNGFSGPIPSSLATLSNLVHLDLSLNRFSGPLPSSLANLSNLVHLYLSSNGFSGPLPSSLANLSNLVHLDLSSNGFSGPIPSSLFSLPSLRELRLQENQFSGQLGEFPDASSSLLEIIVLNDNQLEGAIPRSIFQLTKLTELSLSSNGFNGTIPSLYGNSLHNCIVLDLHNNSLSGTIPSSFFSLPSLRELYLQDNQFSGQLGEFHNPSPSLEKIHLDNNKLEGTIPRSIFELPNLMHLLLSSNNFSGDMDLGLFQNLKNLYRLDLSGNSFSVNDGRSNSTSSMHLPKIEFLFLRSCNITKFPDILRNKKRMQSIDLSNNSINGEIPKWLWKVGNGTLLYLNLSHNALEGLEQPFPHLSLSSLQYLDLSFNRLEGSIPIPPPSTIFYTLSSNNLSGEVPLVFCNCASLQVLDLSDNRFNGSIPRCLGEISDSLVVLNLGGNTFDGTLHQTFKEGCTLETLDLNGNQLEGQLPRSLAECKKLEVLNLGNNQIYDTFPFWLVDLSQLRILILGSNKFHGTIGHPQANHAFPLLQIFDLSSNSFTGSLPSNLFRSLKAMMKEGKSQSQFGSKLSVHEHYEDNVTIVSKGLEMELVKILTSFIVVDLSNNQFHGDIPESIGDLKSLHVLNMSHNHLTGQIPASLKNLKASEGLERPYPHLSFSSLRVLDFSFNMLEGSIPIPPPTTNFYSLSSNKFSGEVPSLICNTTSLQILNLSDNRFNGSIPPCLGEISDALIVLNLGGNSFHGTLPQIFKERCTLETFDFNGNRLEGQVPRSLANCKMLEVLNLGNNQIHDTFPFWLENLSQLRILILRSNKFHGSFRHPLINHTFPLLQIFDLSSNNFMGSLPSNMFRSWKAMMDEAKSQSQVLSKDVEGGYYQDKVTIVNKGQEMKLVKILTAFTVVDLSNNQFHGDIPKLVGDLKSLHVLNMSYNHLEGQIPASLGNMKALESLDLSHNRVSGKIPWQLAKLTFLAVLDLSQNLLDGSIPQGQQFNTFENKSFLGNSGLCGTPLSKKCEHVEASPPLAQLKSKFDWKSMLIGFGAGYGVGLGILFWTLALWTKGMREFTIFIDKVLLLIFPYEAFIVMHRY